MERSFHEEGLPIHPSSFKKSESQTTDEEDYQVRCPFNNTRSIKTKTS